MERRIVSERPVTYSEAREILSKVHEELSGEGEEEYSSVVAEVLEYLSKVAPPLDARKSRELVEKLVGMGVKEVVAVNIANVCPKSHGELMSILVMDREISVPEVASKIYPVVKEYCEEGEK